MITAVDRVDIRMDPEVKRMWERGATIAGVSLSAFIKMAVSQRATELINSHDTLTLTPTESQWLLDLLRQPADEPTPTMRRASSRRRELLGS